MHVVPHACNTNAYDNDPDECQHHNSNEEHLACYLRDLCKQIKDSIKAGIQVAFNCNDAVPGRPAMFTQMCASVATGTISRKPGTGV